MSGTGDEPADETDDEARTNRECGGASGDEGEDEAPLNVPRDEAERECGPEADDGTSRR